MTRIRIKSSDWFSTPSVIAVGSACALVPVSPAGTTVAAESYWEVIYRVGVDRTARQNDCPILHPVIGTASLDNEAWAENTPHVAILGDAQTYGKQQMSDHPTTFI